MTAARWAERACTVPLFRFGQLETAAPLWTKAPCGCSGDDWLGREHAPEFTLGPSRK